MNAFRLRSPHGFRKVTFLGFASLLWLTAMPATAQTNTSASAQDLRLVPFPKSVTLETGRFFFKKSLTFEISDGAGDLPAQLLNAELQRAGLRQARVGRVKLGSPTFRLAVKRHVVELVDT